MAAILIKRIPPGIHRRLKLQAERHHRSMNGEILAILEEKLEGAKQTELPPPLKPLRPISGGEIVKTIRLIREQGQ